MLVENKGKAHLQFSIPRVTQVDRDIDEKFLCFYCKNVPFEAVFDYSCDQSFCRQCLKSKDKDNEEDNDCPKCSELYEERKVSKDELKNIYQPLEFSCEDCGLKYNYNDHRKHLKECEPISSCCILKCGDNKVYTNKTDLLHHLSTSCVKSEFVCNICTRTLSVEEARRHPD